MSKSIICGWRWDADEPQLDPMWTRENAAKMLRLWRQITRGQCAPQIKGQRVDRIAPHVYQFTGFAHTATLYTRMEKLS